MPKIEKDQRWLLNMAETLTKQVMEQKNASAAGSRIHRTANKADVKFCMAARFFVWRSGLRRNN